MSENAVIVALPREGERVYKVSSEKVPHLTLLFLGPVDQIADLEGIVQFTQHAVSVSEHGDFMLDVDHRGTLGEDQADVLFFSKRRGNLKWIEFFRSQLLQNGSIRAAYESTEQYPEWTPHLTLGYPESPAKPDDKDYPYPIDWVSFDRIAVWTGDFDGPEFRLEWPERYDDMEAVRMSGISGAGQAAVADILGLEHHGVKGMKWGQRKDRPSGNTTVDLANGAEIKISNRTGMARPSDSSTAALLGTAVIAPPVIPVLFLSKKFRTEVKASRQHNKGVQAEKKDAKDLSKFEKRVKSAEGFTAIHNGAVPQFNREIGKLNAKKEYQVNLYDHPDVKKKYDAEALKIQQDAYRASANSLMNRKLTHHVDLEFVNDGMDFKIHVKEGMGKPMVEHAATTSDDVETFEGKLKRTETGHIFGLEFDDFDEPTAEHIAEVGEEFLEHYGVKGMKWGVRREDQPGGDQKVGQFDPAGHDLATDVAKSVLWPVALPGVGSVIAIPANVRLARGAVRGTGALARDVVGPKIKQGGKAVGNAFKKAGTKMGDHFWDTSLYSDGSHEAVHNTVAREMDHRVNQLASAPKYRGKNLNANHQLRTEYEQDLAKVTDSAYRRAVKEVYGTNSSGTKAAHYVHDARGPRLEIRDPKGRKLDETPLSSQAEIDKRRAEALNVAHADITPAQEPDISIPLKLDDNGFVIGFGFVLPKSMDEAAHTMDLGEAFLAHYGVKGMRWGVRRDRMQDSRHAKARISEEKRREKRPERDVRVNDSIGTSRRKKATIETEGGEDHRPTEDAIKVAVAKQKLQKSGVHTLSNEELQEVQRRLNLENDVQRLLKGDKSRGQKFVDGLLGRGDKHDKKDFNYQTGSQARGLVTPVVKPVVRQVIKRGTGIPIP